MENLANNGFSTIIKPSICRRHNPTGVFGNTWNIFNSINIQNREKTRKRLGTMNLRIWCKACGHRNHFELNKLFIEQLSSEPKVKVLIPMYEPLKVETCKKCGKVISTSKELLENC